VGNIVLGSSALEISLGLGLANDSGSIHQLVCIYVYICIYIYVHVFIYIHVWI